METTRIQGLWSFSNKSMEPEVNADESNHSCSRVCEQPTTLDWSAFTFSSTELLQEPLYKHIYESVSRVTT